MLSAEDPSESTQAEHDDDDVAPKSIFVVLVEILFKFVDSRIFHLTIRYYNLKDYTKSS